MTPPSGTINISRTAEKVSALLLFVPTGRGSVAKEILSPALWKMGTLTLSGARFILVVASPCLTPPGWRGENLGGWKCSGGVER